MKIISAPFELTATQKNKIAEKVDKFLIEKNYDYADQIALVKPWFLPPKCCGKSMLKVRLYEKTNTCCPQHEKLVRQDSSPIYVCSCIGCDNIGIYFRTFVGD